MLNDRENKLLRMKDLLDHMADCHDQWAWSDGAGSDVLAEVMLRDVEQVKRVCVSLSGCTTDRTSHSLLEGVGA